MADDRPPIQVKHWGIWPITRRRYLISQGMVLLSWLFLFWVNWLMPRPFPALPPGSVYASWLLNVCLHATPWLLGIVGIWWVLDLFFMLRRFAQVKRQANKSD